MRSLIKKEEKMKKLAFFLGIIFLSGCLARTYTTEKPRIDTDIQGNKGYLFGSAPAGSKDEIDQKTRKISVLEVDFGPRHEGRTGEVKSQRVETAGEQKSEEKASLEQEIYAKDEEASQVIESEPKDEATAEEEVSSLSKDYQYYVIEKNDTLQKISQKFYGTTKKWIFLYKENQDVLKGPDKIYPGKKIRIPVLEKK